MFVFFIFSLILFPESAFAASIEGRTTALALERHGKDLAPISEMETTVSAQLFEVTRRYVTIQTRVPSVTCNQSLEIRNEDWKGYFEASLSEKPGRLAQAIQGLSTQTATSMVLNGYFSYRPETWEKFKSEISRAENQFEMGLAYKVLGKNGKENLLSLGYFAEGMCKLEYQMENLNHAVDDKRPFKTVTRQFKLLISGGLLLKAEAERFEISFNGFTDTLKIQSRYNRYTVTQRIDNGDTIIYEISGQRLRLDPDNTLQVIPSRQGKGMILTVVDSAYDPDLGTTQGQSILEADVYQRRKWWFDKYLGKVEAKLSTIDSETTVQTGFKFEPETEAYAIYQLKRQGSFFYTEAPSSSKYTVRLSF